MQLGLGSLADLARLRPFRRRRLSSWDRTGGNKDALLIEPGATISLGEIAGRRLREAHLDHAHVAARASPTTCCTTVLRMFWDGEASPSVEAPIGDFFGIGFGLRAQLRVAAAADEPRGRQRLQLLVPDALRERRALRGREPGRRSASSSSTTSTTRSTHALEADLAPLPRVLEPAQPDRRHGPRAGLDPRATTASTTSGRWARASASPDPGTSRTSTGARNYVILDVARRRPVRRLQPQRRRLRAPGERLVRRGRRHDLHRRRALAAAPARNRHGGLLQHRLLPDAGVLRAVPRRDASTAAARPGRGAARTRCTASTSRTRSASSARSGSRSRPGTTTRSRTTIEHRLLVSAGAAAAAAGAPAGRGEAPTARPARARALTLPSGRMREDA